ncbi:hypothetical protein CAL13_15800 [Bordetella genomosp. 9]|uniref:Caa(3)-type oxidase subunit IV n=2 Tax=Bordetella genomosp. 9 TaxID=1416803 RepID=A0A1W6Z2B8_9BORD|nr:hypothetical protein CAL13_15800 [Bordetella genomosp. 9]
MILALATVGSAYVPMGPWNAVANFAIAAIKAGLVAAYFMQLRAGSPVPRLIAGTAIAVGALLFALGGVDYATRRPPAPPPSAPDAVWAAPGAAIPPAAEDRRPAAP